MKKSMVTALIFSVALFLAACAKTPPAEPNPALSHPDASISSDPAPVSAASSEQSGRASTTDLQFIQNGASCSLAASLYTGEGYSLYLPDEDWTMETDGEDGLEVWESTVNDAAQLRILHLGETTMEQARADLIREEASFSLVEDKRGGLFGTDSQNGQELEISFFPSETGTLYAVALTYPTEATEELGALLHVMADTFALHP